jgi:dipeptide/tripeptide permease
LTMGALLFSAAFMLYALMGRSNLTFLCLCIFFGTIGLIQMDVMADTMCVERSKFELEESKGQMQATCYSVRFGGSLVGAVLGALVCNEKDWGWGLSFYQVAMVNGLVPFLCVTPWLFWYLPPPFPTLPNPTQSTHTMC